MRISKDVLELAEEIRRKRIKETEFEKLKIEKESQEKQIKTLEKFIKDAKMHSFEEDKLRDMILKLEKEKRDLRAEMETVKNSFRFIVTKPKGCTNTVHGEINSMVSSARKEILICSPWITYILEELSSLGRRHTKPAIRVITRLTKDDILKGMTDPDKLRMLSEDMGAEIRFNNELHAKIITVDGAAAIISSANLTHRGLHANYETGVSIRDRSSVAEIMDFFDDVWGKSLPLTGERIKECMDE